MTERIYYRDAYETEFTARILSRSPDGLCHSTERAMHSDKMAATTLTMTRPACGRVLIWAVAIRY